MSCDLNSSVTVDYNSIDTSFGQEKDPLLPADGGPPNPINSLSTDNCPGMNLQTYSSPLPDNTSVLYPGVYTQPVDLTGSATFEDCSGYSGQPANNGNPEGAYPGIYVFTDGLTIDPAAGDTVSGSDIVIATQSPYPVAGNVPGSVTGGMFTASGAGNGAPCLPEGTLADTQSADGVSPGYETVQGGTPCGGTNPAEYGVEAYTDLPIQQDTTETGTGTNFSLIVGGGTGSKVSLTGPTTGAYGGGRNRRHRVLSGSHHTGQLRVRRRDRRFGHHPNQRRGVQRVNCELWRRRPPRLLGWERGRRCLLPGRHAPNRIRDRLDERTGSVDRHWLGHPKRNCRGRRLQHRRVHGYHN